MALLPGAARASGQIPGYYFPEGERPFWEGPWDILGGWIPEPVEYLWDIVTETLNPPVPVAIGEIPQTWEEYEELYPEYFEPILETRPGRTPDPYPQTVALPPPEQLPAEPDEEEPMAHDWGHLAREFLGGVGSSILGPGAGGSTVYNPPGEFMGPSTPANQMATAAAAGAEGCDGMVWAGGAPPKGYKVVNSCGVGVLRKVRRRRRKRMLTVSDKNDISAIISMVGKGQLAATLMNRGG